MYFELMWAKSPEGHSLGRERGKRWWGIIVFFFFSKLHPTKINVPPKAWMFHFPLDQKRKKKLPLYGVYL